MIFQVPLVMSGFLLYILFRLFFYYLQDKIRKELRKKIVVNLLNDG